MKIISPNVEIWTPLDSEEVSRFIERCARNCYKSEGSINEQSAEKMISMLIKRGHEAMLEHFNITVKFTNSLHAYKDLTRHRHASFAIESTRWCLAGDTRINNRYTLEDLYNRNFTQYGKTHNKTLRIRAFDPETYQVIPEKIKNIFYNGEKEVYELTTKLGYKIKATLDHQFFSSEKNYKSLRDLKIGDKIYVNGRPSLLKISNEELTNLYLEEHYTPLEIADLYHCKVRSVWRRLRQLNIFKIRLNDKNKEKYRKNHTKEVYAKMAKTKRELYASGVIKPWNKDVRENEHSSVKKQANALRKYHFNGFAAGINHPSYKPETQGYHRCHYNFPSLEGISCEICGSPAKERHHIDKNPNHNTRNNIMFLCSECHHKIHHGWLVGKKIHLDEIISIERKDIEKVYDLEIDSKNHNYIANGFVVHNCNYSTDKFGNELTFVKPYGLEEGTELYKLWEKQCLACEKSYLEMKDKGATNDQASDVLNQSVKADVVMTCNLREWRYLLKLRTNKDVYPNIRIMLQDLLMQFIIKLPLFFKDLEGQLEDYQPYIDYKNENKNSI